MDKIVNIWEYIKTQDILYSNRFAVNNELKYIYIHFIDNKQKIKRIADIDFEYKALYLDGVRYSLSDDIILNIIQYTKKTK